jgi:hypothetical protein
MPRQQPPWATAALWQRRPRPSVRTETRKEKDDAKQDARKAAGGLPRGVDARDVGPAGSAGTPQVRFSSTLINEVDGTMAVVGHLEAVGRKVPIALDATVRRVGDDLEMEATTTVDQRELGLTFSPLGMIRTPSTLHVEARLAPDRGDDQVAT